jgi:hypothetical protein
MLVDVQAYEFIKRRASFAVYTKFNINRFELWYLVSLSGYLEHLGKQQIGRTTFHRQITSNSREKAKFNGYLKGNVDKGFIELVEYISKPGTTSLSITDLGFNVIRMHLNDVNNYLVRMTINKGKDRIAA